MTLGIVGDLLDRLSLWPAATVRSAEGALEATPPSVLVVDDSPVAREALVGMLSREGFTLSTAASSGEAMEVIGHRATGPFDVILMDLQLPDGSGVDACARIRQRPGWQDVPVIVVTSSDDDRDLTQAFAAGAVDYITKPPREMELLARVRSAVQLTREMGRRRAHEQELERLNGRLRAQAHDLAAAQGALVTLNRDLEQRVQAQVAEITSRAREVEALNRELRVQVQERSGELAQALRRLSRDKVPAPLPTAGTVLGGRVRLVQHIAKGGMGVIYSGIDLVSGSAVAVKLLDPALSLREGDLQRFIAEASAAAAVAHPALVVTRHVDVSADGTPFLVMELVDGVTLASLMARRTLEPAWAASIGHVVADALAAAHRADVIHRDVKPANLMLCRRRPGVRVLDFGISKLRVTRDRALTQTGVVLGTPAYMAPEQFEDPVAVTPASDVFSLGVVLFQGLTGALPYQAHDWRLRLLEAPSVRKAVELAPHVPARLAALVDRCLARDPVERPSARDLADALASLGRALDAPAPETLLAQLCEGGVRGAAGGSR